MPTPVSALLHAATLVNYCRFELRNSLLLLRYVLEQSINKFMQPGETLEVYKKILCTILLTAPRPLRGRGALNYCYLLAPRYDYSLTRASLGPRGQSSCSVKILAKIDWAYQQVTLFPPGPCGAAVGFNYSPIIFHAPTPKGQRGARGVLNFILNHFTNSTLALWSNLVGCRSPQGSAAGGSRPFGLLTCGTNVFKSKLVLINHRYYSSEPSGPIPNTPLILSGSDRKQVDTGKPLKVYELGVETEELVKVDAERAILCSDINKESSETECVMTFQFDEYFKNKPLHKRKISQSFLEWFIGFTDTRAASRAGRRRWKFYYL